MPHFWNGDYTLIPDDPPAFFALDTSAGRRSCRDDGSSFRTRVGSFALYRVTRIVQESATNWRAYSKLAMPCVNADAGETVYGVLDIADRMVQYDDRNNALRYMSIQTAVRAIVARITPVHLVHDGRRIQYVRECSDCADIDDGPTLFVTDDRSRELCDDCSEVCERCGSHVNPDEMAAVRVGHDWAGRSEAWCESCREENTFSCEHCETLWSDNRARECGSCGTVCVSCYSESVNHCESCDETYCDSTDSHDDCGENEDHPNVHGYSYKPRAKFKGDGPAYLGMELEITASARKHAALISDEEEHVYLKSDSSINGGGFEIVSHPASLTWWAESFGWHKLRDLYNAGARAGGNGLHVHISRDAFDDAAHIVRWHDLMYGNQSQVERIARRSGSTWAKFNDRDDVVDKAKGGSGRDRYQAINAENAATFEIRVFASSLNPEKVRAALEYVHASCEYTRGMEDDTAIAGGLTWASFGEYVADCTIYSNLWAQMVKQSTVFYGPHLPALRDDVIAAYLGKVRGTVSSQDGLGGRSGPANEVPVPREQTEAPWRSNERDGRYTGQACDCGCSTRWIRAEDGGWRWNPGQDRASGAEGWSDFSPNGIAWESDPAYSDAEGNALSQIQIATLRELAAIRALFNSVD